MVEQQVSHTILEVSSHGIALNRIEDIKFDIGGITNISLDHLELHQSIDEYANTKGKFFTFLSRENTAIFNGDDPLSLKLISQTSAQTIIYGIDSNLATIKAVSITRNSDCTKFDVFIQKPFFTISRKKIEPTSFSINLHCPGNHNIYNALLAIANCLILDLSIKEIQIGMDTFQGVPRRLDVIYDHGFKVINDVAHNPGGAIQKSIYCQLYPW